MSENEAVRYWQIRAAEAAAIAEIADDDDDRQGLLRIADIFDAMAKRAQRRAYNDNNRG